METKSTNKEETKGFKKIVFLSILIIIMLSILAGCNEQCTTHTYTGFDPVFAERSEVMSTADFIVPQPIESLGKIYYKDQHIFISESNRGIHVINNQDPANPENIGFISLPGNKDLAAKGNYLYADNYLDLVVLDITDKTNIFETNRIENVFDQYYWFDEELGLVVDQVEVERSYEECEESAFERWRGRGVDTQDDAIFVESSSIGGNGGIGGSLARFTIVQDYLYTVNDYRMKVFDINLGDSPVDGEDIDLGWGIETIFPYGDKLYLGARTGMHIYDNAVPSSPEYISTYAHINTCDPVVVQGDYAYVTLRSGTECETFTNQLDVIDVSDAYNPSLVSTFEMQNPHGLGIIGDCLFIAEGMFGLKLFNAADPMTIGNNLIHHHKDIHALDVIPLSNILMMIGDDGLYQYTYDCNNKLEVLSVIGF